MIMRVGTLKELLRVFPDNMEIYIQTCEGDLLSPLELNNIWSSEAFIDEKYKTLESAKLCLTAFIKGREKYNYQNDQRGYRVMRPDELPEPPTEEAP